MNTIALTKWDAFKSKLQEHADLTLQFQYAEGKFVDPSYHLTEIKQAPIVSVDCGGVMNSWTEVIVQLWEPSVKESEHAMPVHKALSIIALVEKSLPLNPLALVKIEFGNSQFDTRQMYPAEFIIDGENLIINLIPDVTQCKAIERGGSCGTTAEGEVCCNPEPAAETPKIALINLAQDDQVCTPGGGCC